MRVLEYECYVPSITPGFAVPQLIISTIPALTWAAKICIWLVSMSRRLNAYPKDFASHNNYNISTHLS